jgi:hypothetical protein
MLETKTDMSTKTRLHLTAYDDEKREHCGYVNKDRFEDN